MSNNNTGPKAAHLLALSSLLAIACGGDSSGDAQADAAVDVPANPTWFGDIQQILSDNCVQCHQAPAQNGAPGYFRLDRFVAQDGMEVPAPVFDAFDMSAAIVARAVDYEANALAPMPPSGDLSARDKATLTLWLEQGALKGTRDNQSPTATLLIPTEVPSSADQSLAIQFTSEDVDNDGLIVSVGYRLAGSSDEPTVFATDLRGGTIDLDLDLGLLASMQRFDIIAIVDDGYSDIPSENKSPIVLLSDLLVDHGERGTAPTVHVDSPNGGNALSGLADITWTASDPDAGDVLSISLDLIRLDAAGTEVSTSSIATGLANTPSSFSWDLDGVATEEGGSPIPYKIRVSASDAGNLNTRSDESDSAFTILPAGGTTTLSWESDIKPIFITYCGECHRQPARNPPLEYFRLDKYNAADTEAPANADIGVFEQRLLVFQRLVVESTMPPNGQAQPLAEELAKIREWIEAGAPENAGSGDGPPTFTWNTPNDVSTTTTGSAQVTLSWMASDPEGMPLTGSIVMAEINAMGNPLVVSCPTTLTNAVEVMPSSNIEDGSFLLTLPNTGKFCFQGTVTDAAGQSTSSISAFGIKY